MTQRVLGCQHQKLGPFEPQPNDVHVRCRPVAFLEGPAEMTDAERHLFGELLHVQRLIQVLFQIPVDLAFLPRRKTATRARGLSLDCECQMRHQAQSRRPRTLRVLFHRAANVIEDPGDLVRKPSRRAMTGFPFNNSERIHWRFLHAS
jgi:hypothetical protein